MIELTESQKQRLLSHAQASARSHYNSFESCDIEESIQGSIANTADERYEIIDLNESQTAIPRGLVRDYLTQNRDQIRNTMD